jgi:CheY-like chemotaxis protein
MTLALLVEDNATNRKLLRDILEMEFEVIEADSAERAADLLKLHNPDLIFMDVQLPGVDGLTFIRRLKQEAATQAIPIVAISAHAMPDDIQQAMASGCTEYITKPLVEDPLEFVERMKRLAVSAEA